MGANSTCNCFPNTQTNSQEQQIELESQVPSIRINIVQREEMKKKEIDMEQNFGNDQLKISTVSVSTQPASSSISKNQNKQIDFRNNEKLSTQTKTAKGFSKLNIADFKILSMLGRGHFAKVLLASRNISLFDTSSTKYAIKVIRKEQVFSKELLKSLKLEKQILENSASPFIPKLYAAFSDHEYYYLAMEYAEGGDSYSLIKKDTPRRPLFEKAGENALRFLLGCIILGLEELHSQGVLFGDLKPENVLLFKDGYAKLTDFGLSHKLLPQQKIQINSGSPLYIAPEVNKDKCGFEIDLWALGIFAYEMSNMATPFNHHITKTKKIFSKAVENFHETKIWHNRLASDNLKDLVHGLLKLNPSERLGAKGLSEVKNHPFFKAKDFGWDKLAKKQIESPLLAMLAEKIEHRPASEANLSFRVEEFSDISN